ncbi:hypothetical protein Tco_1247173 [Tanacetum coccineum]
MASLDRRLNPLYAIKECSSCGNLHTKDCGCSIGSLEDKILVPTLEEVFQDFQDTSKSSDDDTNFVNQNSSQSPPQINHNCCYECGDSLDGIFCQQCTCKSCGKGAHYGYNCPPQILIISIRIHETIKNFRDPSKFAKNIDYVDASPPDAEIVSLEVVEIVISEVGGIDDRYYY